jgi:Spy/CpxP family protein refolding chaperone
MKNKIFIGVTIFVLLAGLFVVRAETHGWHRGFGHRGWHHGALGYVAKELKLTDTQKQQIQTIWESERPTLLNLAKQFAEQNKDLNAATAKGVVNEAEASRIAALQGATLAQLILEKEHLKAKIYTTVLTPEQQNKADALLTRWQSHLLEFTSR